MWMEVHIYNSINAKSEASNMRVKDVMTILKIYAFYQKIQQRASGQGKSAAEVMYLSKRIHPKNYSIFPLEVAATLLSGSRKGTIGA